jgi:hypothetical protein
MMIKVGILIVVFAYDGRIWNALSLQGFLMVV